MVQYRFGVGNLVLYKQRRGWFEGEVVRVGDAGSDETAYVVQPYDDDPLPNRGSSRGGRGREIQIRQDTDDSIRRRPENLAPDPTKFRPPSPKDINSYLYTGQTSNPISEDGHNLAEAFERMDPSVRKAAIQPDGSIMITHRDGRVISTSNFLYETEEVCGVPSHFVSISGVLIANRRRIDHLGGVPDWIANFLSAVPEEKNLRALVQESKNSNKKMLQLADGLMIGIHGWPRDPNRSSSCYRAAALGCSEREVTGRDGVPVGLPEAMIATAQIVVNWIKFTIMEIAPTEHVPYQCVLRAALEDGQYRIINQLFYWIYHAATRGWVSPESIQFAMACDEINIRDHREDIGVSEDIIQTILNINKWRKLEIEYEERMNKGLVPRGIPTADTITLFQPKALEIFQALPINNQPIHIEFRELPRAPFPVVVYALVPSQRKALKVFRLPDKLQLAPFSKESFQYAWLMVAFELHLGDPKRTTGRNKGPLRERPPKFTILDSPDNRKFACYLQEDVFGVDAAAESATEVQLVTRDMVIRQQLIRQERLVDMVDREEKKFLNLPKYINDVESAEDSILMAAQHEVARQYLKGISDHDDDHDDDGRQHDYQQEANSLKEQGNTLFAAEAFTNATKCYAVAIFLLKQQMELDQDSSKLLGTLLSNRAASYLEMTSRRTNVDFQRLLLRNAARDCRMALNNGRIRTLLPSGTKEKLKFRLDQAIARLDIIGHERTTSRTWTLDFKHVESTIIDFSWKQITVLLWIMEWIRNVFVVSIQGAGRILLLVYQWMVSALTAARDRLMKNHIEENTGTRDDSPPIDESAETDDNRQPTGDSVASQSGTHPEPTLDARPILPYQQVAERNQPTHRTDSPTDALLKAGQIIHDHSLAKNFDDGCPVCLKSFTEELAQSLVCGLPCGEHALCIECVCSIKKSSDRVKRPMECPLCRVNIDSTFAEDLSFQIIRTDETLLALTDKLPIEEANDREAVVQRLLWTHEFRVDCVVDSIEKMLDDRTRERFFRTEMKLNHNQKEEVYQTARRPVILLQDKLARLVEERRTTFQSARLIQLNTSICEVRSDLAAARIQAREQIYRRMNEVGSMGAENESSSSNHLSVIPIDYHGMHVGEMISKFQELVIPILPVTKEVLVITGRGLHSEGGESKLKKALIRHIDNNEDDIRWERIPSNPGALKILWKPRSRRSGPTR